MRFLSQEREKERRKRKKRKSKGKRSVHRVTGLRKDQCRDGDAYNRPHLVFVIRHRYSWRPKPHEPTLHVIAVTVAALVVVEVDEIPVLSPAAVIRRHVLQLNVDIVRVLTLVAVIGPFVPDAAFLSSAAAGTVQPGPPHAALSALATNPAAVRDSRTPLLLPRD
jgi:hypothetical protein